MTLQLSPGVMTVPYASSSGATSPGFTDLRLSALPAMLREDTWIEVEDPLRLDAYWFAMAWGRSRSSDSTSASSVPDWTSIPLLGAEQGVEMLSPAEQLKTITKTLSLSKVELAKSLGVSRQAIYDWLGEQPVSAENEDRLLHLARLAWDFGGREGKSLLRRFVATSAREGDSSILEMLLDPPWNEPKLRRALAEARSKTERRKTGSVSAWLGSLGFPDPEPSEKAANQDHNLLLDDSRRS
jgi:transcriptional regulator with XRE-family HTH domain